MLFESASAYVNCSASDNIIVTDDARRQLLNYCDARSRATALSSIYVLASVRNLYVQYRYGGSSVFSVAFDWFVIDSPLTTQSSTSAPVTGTTSTRPVTQTNAPTTAAPTTVAPSTASQGSRGMFTNNFYFCSYSYYDFIFLIYNKLVESQVKIID